MTAHPPADQRCQIYTQLHGGDELVRCSNRGTHWVQWGGCNCADPDPDLCESEFTSWECDDHSPNAEEAA